MRDRRRHPFCYQDHEAIEAIQQRFSGRRRVTALALYSQMTFAASRQHDSGGRGGFKASVAELAEMTGTGRPTVLEFAAELEQLGLVSKDRQVDDAGRDVASVWSLTSPSRVVTKVTTGDLEPVTKVTTRSSTRAQDPGFQDTREPLPLRLEEFVEWCEHHSTTTGDPPIRPKTAAYRTRLGEFSARRAEGYSLAELKLATVGAFSDEFRRSNGHYGHQSILRPTKIAELIAKGKRAAAGDGEEDRKIEQLREYGEAQLRESRE